MRCTSFWSSELLFLCGRYFASLMWRYFVGPSPRLHLSTLCRGCEEGAHSTPHLTLIPKYLESLNKVLNLGMAVLQPPLHPAHPCGPRSLVQINAPSQERMQRVPRRRGLLQGIRGYVLEGSSTGDLWNSHRRVLCVSAKGNQT